MKIDSVRLAMKLHAPYSVTRQLFLRRLARRAANACRQVVVYQMGKVGSSTVARTLSSTRDDLLVHQVHTLTDSGMLRVERIHRQEWPKWFPRHLWVSEFLRERIDRSDPTGLWKLITLVRDPVARNISSFFQIAQLEFGIDLAGLETLGDDEAIAAEVRRLFLEVFEQHDRPLDWFDCELRTVLGLDVFCHPFPHQNGWDRWQERNVDLLIMRLEDLDRVGASALSDFLDIPLLELAAANVGSRKSYAPIYSAFLRNACLPEEYLEHMYSSKFSQHFYSHEERDAFASRWQNPALSVSEGGA